MELICALTSSLQQILLARKVKRKVLAKELYEGSTQLIGKPQAPHSKQNLAPHRVATVLPCWSLEVGSAKGLEVASTTPCNKHKPSTTLSPFEIQALQRDQSPAGVISMWCFVLFCFVCRRAMIAWSHCDKAKPAHDQSLCSVADGASDKHGLCIPAPGEGGSGWGRLRWRLLAAPQAPVNSAINRVINCHSMLPYMITTRFTVHILSHICIVLQYYSTTLCKSQKNFLTIWDLHRVFVFDLHLQIVFNNVRFLKLFLLNLKSYMYCRYEDLRNWTKWPAMIKTSRLLGRRCF